MAPQPLEDLIEKLAGAVAIDTVAKPLAKKVASTVPHGPAKDALSGTWLGHPLHPLLTDLPIGCWTSAMALDLFGGRRGRPGAQFLVAAGILAVVPTAATGLSDWSDTLGEDRRLGFVHAVTNTVAVGLYALSWRARHRGEHAKGVVLGLVGGTVATASAYLGGHLAWRRGVNVDRHAFQHHEDGWIDVGSYSDLEDGRPVATSVGDDDVLIVRLGNEVFAVSDVCGHAGGPLHEGTVEGRCVTCPWHGSVFSLDDGHVVHGPATGPQPGYDVRVIEGRVAVRHR